MFTKDALFSKRSILYGNRFRYVSQKKVSNPTFNGNTRLLFFVYHIFLLD